MATVGRHSDGVYSSEAGFTLIELMIVTLIIAILIAIAVPTMLAARQRANARAAQVVLRNALAAEETYFADGQTFTQTAGDLRTIEPSILWVPAAGPPAPTDPVGQVNMTVHNSQAVNDFTAVCLYAHSKAGTDFAIKVIPVDGSPTPATGAFYFDDSTGMPTCAVSGSEGGRLSWL
jgi:prepilin-type N-terminal cleavage/methylation domain-containing protein